MQRLRARAQQAEAAGSSSFCNPAALHNAVVLRLVILDEAIATSNQAIVDSAYGTLYDTTRRALACMPADPFAWLTLFWLDVTKRGVRAENANYLRLSYALGPNESWIALWRNKLAFSLFERLPTDLSDDALDEFIKLVDTGQLYSETATIFSTATPAVQSRIVERLKTTKPIYRNMFARMLYDRGWTSISRIRRYRVCDVGSDSHARHPRQSAERQLSRPFCADSNSAFNCWAKLTRVLPAGVQIMLHSLANRMPDGLQIACPTVI